METVGQESGIDNDGRRVDKGNGHGLYGLMGQTI